jgi:hypothetical protein
MTDQHHRTALLTGAALLLLQSAPAWAQQPQAEQPAGAPFNEEVSPQADEAGEGEEEEIVVVGQRLRGSVVGDIPPESTLDSRDVRATGATNINELLEALGPQIGSARGRGGERPVLLLNGQRISGFRELRDIPTEAISRVEILPEEVALKYGYRADQRVVNIVLRQRFRSSVARSELGTATDGDYLTGLGDFTRLLIGNEGRTTINLRSEANSRLSEAERDIALQPVAGNPTLDPREGRTLLGSQRLVRGTATHNRTLFGDVSATFNGELEHSEGRSLIGYPVLDNGIPIVGEADPRRRNTTSDSAHAGFALNGELSAWRWSVTGNADLVRSVTRTDPNDIAGSRDRAALDPNLGRSRRHRQWPAVRFAGRRCERDRSGWCQPSASRQQQAPRRRDQSQRPRPHPRQCRAQS